MTITDRTVRGSMTDASRTVVDGVQLASGMYLADITDAIGVTRWDFRVGAVSEFSFPAVDRNRQLSKRGLLREGVTLRWDGQVWQIAAVERDYKGEDIWLNFTARSRLARRLRNMTGKRSAEKSTPQAFIGAAVKKAGGLALVEPGAGSMRIVQKRDESVLDVIASIASDTGVEWVEHGNTFFVGTPWWAFQGNTNLPTWSVRTDGRESGFGRSLSMLSLSSRSSLDDRRNAAEASMTVEAATGSQVRPWHRVDVSRADAEDNGIWLVSDVTFDETAGSADLSLQRPLKSSPKKASQGTSKVDGVGDGGDLSSLDGEWIQGADKVWPRCTRTPRQYVAWARSQVGQGFGYNQCLAWVSIAVSGTQGRGGYYARYVWEKAPSSAVKSAGDTNPPIGAIVVWSAPTGGGAGHIGISVGGGRFISATGGRVVELGIAGFGSYYGAMTPSFYV
ncbi:MAG: CHAP domain-containing protein [Chromatiaceae bacterium]|nr:CHAP domain-containing protein [Chromatiaceae bacterium]